MKISTSSISPNDLAEFGVGSQERVAYSTHKEGNETTENNRDDSSQTPLSSNYAGDAEDNSPPLREEGYQSINEVFPTLNYRNPAQLVVLHTKSFREGIDHLHDWQITISDELAESNKTASSQHPYKHALCAANGSGKDAFVVAPFVIWFALVNVKSLSIITSSSGSQLTAQTENYIRALAHSINEYFGQPFFRIRQRFIKCNLTGSEIRLFATDEEGKAEGYHPLEPRAKMCIIVNEAKSVPEEIFRALKRCTGFTHWLNVSTPGAMIGMFYWSFNNWPNKTHIDYTRCPHMSEDERLEDLARDGEHSSYYRSKWLALFTSQDGSFIIMRELVDQILASPPAVAFQEWPDRIGIDLSAGGDEAGLCHCKGNKLKKELFWREKDTTITADNIEAYLKNVPLQKEFVDGLPNPNYDAEKHGHIYADDGGVGHSIIDMLVRKGWHINRVVNQSRATRPKQFGNKGAENWDRCKRFFEERVFNPVGMSDKLITQLTTRRFKQTQIASGRTFLEKKSEAKSQGFPSPDRADAFILSLTGLTLDDFLKDVVAQVEKKVQTKLANADEVLAYLENERYGGHKAGVDKLKGKRVYGSLAAALTHN